jgi:hypothetical protein
MRIIMVVLLPILAAVAGYYAFKSISNIQSKPSEQMQTVNNQAKNPHQTTLDHTSNTPSTYIAPVAYSEPEKKPLPPYPAACMQSKSNGCQCYSDKAAKLEVPYPVCMKIVQGYFVEWESQAHTGDAVTRHDGGSAPMVADTI